MRYFDNEERNSTDRVHVIRTQREMTESAAYQSGNYEIVEKNVCIAPGDGGAHLYAIHSEDVRVGEWIYDEKGEYITERVE